MKDWKKEILTVPNLLSLFRLVLIPVYILLYLNADSASDYIVAAAVLAVSCLTDMVDGKIARRFNAVSHVGKVLDPLADKATQFSIMLCLAVKKPVLWPLLILFVVKECFQLIAGILTLRKGEMLTGALFTGKISTTVLFVSLIILVLLPDLEAKIVHTIIVADAVVLLIAFVDYIRVYLTHSSEIQKLETAKKNDP